jgi:hypothetical protein
MLICFPRSRLIATYSLCGFGNLGSVATQIEIIAQIAPQRAGNIASVSAGALVTGDTVDPEQCGDSGSVYDRFCCCGDVGAAGDEKWDGICYRCG